MFVTFLLTQKEQHSNEQNDKNISMITQLHPIETTLLQY